MQFGLLDYEDLKPQTRNLLSSVLPMYLHRNRIKNILYKNEKKQVKSECMITIASDVCRMKKR